MDVVIPTNIMYTGGDLTAPSRRSEATDDPTPERPAPSTDRRRADAPDADQPRPERTRQPCRARQDCAGGGGGADLSGRRPCCWAALGRGRRPGGDALQPSRGAGDRTAAWRGPHHQLSGPRTRTDSGRGPAQSRPRAGWNSHVVAQHLAPGPANRPRWLAAGQHLYHLAGAARGRLELATLPHLVSHRNRQSQTQGRAGRRDRSRYCGKKNLIEDAYRLGEALGLSVWTQDEAGPFQTVPYAGEEWQPQEQPKQQPHEYVRDGTAKCLTLFHPADGQIRIKGVTHCPNTVLHAWLEQELTTILAELPASPLDLVAPPPLPDDLPALRMLLIWDNLKGHKTPTMVAWLMQHGIMPLYTPLGGSWLNMAESIQRILKRRALDGQHPTTTDEIIAWLEAVGRAWNRHP